MRLSLLLLAAAAAALAGSAPVRVALAGDPIPSDAGALTDKVRAEAQAHIDAITKGAGDVAAPRRALVKMGPIVWPVVENALKLLPPEAAKPHLNLVRALIAKKKEPEFEALRERLRTRFLTDSMEG